MRAGFWIMLTLVSVAMLSPVVPGAPVEHADKLAHFGLFGALASAARLSGGVRTRGASSDAPTRRALQLLCLTMILAFGFEAAQEVMPRRSGDVMDLLANLLGAATGWAAAHRIGPSLGRVFVKT